MTAREQLRLAAVLDAMPDFDPGAVLAEETEAHRMLYSGLDERHWTFLLAAEARRIFVQCPRCWTRWWHDTGFGVGDRPESLNAPLILPGVA